MKTEINVNDEILALAMELQSWIQDGCAINVLSSRMFSKVGLLEINRPMIVSCIRKLQDIAFEANDHAVSYEISFLIDRVIMFAESMGFMINEDDLESAEVILPESKWDDTYTVYVTQYAPHVTLHNTVYESDMQFQAKDYDTAMALFHALRATTPLHLSHVSVKNNRTYVVKPSEDF